MLAVMLPQGFCSHGHPRCVALQMVLLPRWSVTRRVVRSPLVLVPLAAVYGVLLCWSWQPDTFSLILPGSWAEGFKGTSRPHPACLGP